MKIAIQGIKGSNHHQAAVGFFGEDVELLECVSFECLAERILDRRADRAIMAIENSIAGSIIPNYALVHRHQLCITGEYYLEIRHHLMVLGGQEMKDIKEVHSHPMALLQCMDFLNGFPELRRVETTDTAASAQRIGQAKLFNVAAIAPQNAADLYGLTILERDIQTIKNNATRFVVLAASPEEFPMDGIDKASLRFVTAHKRGSLAAVLNVMSDCNLNLTKIQSLPIIETPWKYCFFVDVTFDHPGQFRKAEALLRIMAEDFRVLGLYKNALNV